MVLTEIIPSIYIGGVDDVLDAAAAGCTYILSVCPGGIGEGKDLPTECTNHMAVEVCSLFLSIWLDDNAALYGILLRCLLRTSRGLWIDKHLNAQHNTTFPRFHYPHPSYR